MSGDDFSCDRIWRYRTRNGAECTVVGHRVEFAPGHVVWTDREGRTILAESNANVNELSEPANGGSATRGTRPQR